MQETARRLQRTYELFVSEWDTLIEALAKCDLIPLLNSRGIDVDHVSRHHKRNYGGRRWDIDIVTVNSREVVAVLVRTTLKRDGVDGVSGHVAARRRGDARVCRASVLQGGRLPAS